MERDPFEAGRTVVVVTTPTRELEIGHVFLVVDGRLFGLMPEPGRPATRQEQLEARPPYSAVRHRNQREQRAELSDELLADQEAIRLARIEQQRKPGGPAAADRSLKR